MVITVGTPEGWPTLCDVCGRSSPVVPCEPIGDAPCPHCGNLLWPIAENRSPTRAVERAPARSMSFEDDSPELVTDPRYVRMRVDISTLFKIALTLACPMILTGVFSVSYGISEYEIAKGLVSFIVVVGLASFALQSIHSWAVGRTGEPRPERFSPGGSLWDRELDG